MAPQDAGALAGISPAWCDFLTGLAKGSVILDAGTGNGVLAARAARLSRDAQLAFKVHGVDLADIDPAAQAAAVGSVLGDIHFHPRTPLEALPFSGSFFDAVMGQFALEYSDTTRSIAEVVRVLRPGGCFRFLVHSRESVLARRCAMQWRQAETVLGSSLFARLESLLEAVCRAEADAAALEHALGEINAFKAESDRLDSLFDADSDRRLIDNLWAAIRLLPDLRHGRSAVELRAMARELQFLLMAQARRFADMARACLDQEQAMALAARFSDAGAVGVSIEAAQAGGLRIGHWVTGRARGINPA